MTARTVVAALLATSLFSGLGAVFLFLSQDRMHSITSYLISLSAGSILGGVFIHLVFRLVQKGAYTRFTGLLVISGVVGSLVLERVVHWHCHAREEHVEPFSYVLMAGDSVHNILDGILIASSFLAGASAGIAATLAVMMHKVPKEAGDFGVLVHSGFSRYQALGFNIAVSLLMFVGAGMVFLLFMYTGGVVSYLLPLVIGNFVYIAGADLIPEFRDSDDEILGHLLMFALGVGLMYLVPFVKRMLL